MLPVKISPAIHWVGLNDRITPIFEGTWPLQPAGVSYNAYLIKDEKNVLIDPGPAFAGGEIIARINTILPVTELDYIVVNHIEPDHAGAIATMLQAAPKAVLVGNAKTFDMLKNYLPLDGRTLTVKNDETLSLGKHTLQFIVIPFLHWPETMMTYETSERIIFSCDNYGGYGALKGTLFADETPDRWLYISEALRYFVTVMVPFSKPLLKAVDKMNEIRPVIVAPSHGLVWRDGVDSIVAQYGRWAQYAAGKGEPGITILYASMYGNTTRMVDAMASGILKTGLPFEIFDCQQTDVSYILPALLKYQGVLIGSATFEGALMPQVSAVLDMAVRKKILQRQAAVFGGYSWGGLNRDRLDKVKESLGWQFSEPFSWMGACTLDDLACADQYAQDFAKSLV